MSTFPSQFSVPGTQDREAAWDELGRVLHTEITRLPDKYRIPVILSYLEGMTIEDVARLLRWPVGLVRGRLTRASSLLRTQMTRRGVGLSGTFLLTALADGAVFAEVVPDDLIEQTMVLIREFKSPPALFERLPSARLTIESSLRSRIVTVAEDAPIHPNYAIWLLVLLVASAVIGMAAALG